MKKKKPFTQWRIVEHESLFPVAKDWDSFLPPHHSLKSYNLLAMENSQLPNLQFIYLQIFDKENVIGQIYLQHLKITPEHFNGTALDKPGLTWVMKCVNSQFSDVLICGNIFRIHFPGYYFKNIQDEAKIFNFLFDYVNEKKAVRYCGVLLKDCVNPIQNPGFFKSYRNDVTMELEVNFKNFEAYRSLLNKKYKQRLDKITKSLEGISLVEFEVADIKANAEKINELYLNVAKKQAYRMSYVNALYFENLKVAHGKDFIFQAYYFKDQLLAFSTHILYENNEMEIHFIGLDYQYNEKFNLYFNILFNGLKVAIEKKMKRLELGRTARLAKASMGALPVEMTNYVYIRKGIPALAFSFFNKWFSKSIGEEWLLRKPFKPGVQISNSPVEIEIV